MVSRLTFFVIKIRLGSPRVAQFFKKDASRKTENALHPSIEAETKMAMFIVQHNTFFNLSDHMTQFIKREFTGSKAAENFACGRTKTSAIVNALVTIYLHN